MATQDVQAALQLLSNPNADWSSLLGPDYQQAMQNASNNALASEYGYYMTGQPAAGTPTLAADEQIGMFQGQPLAAEQEAYGQFGPNMGYLAGKPTLTAQEQYGNSNGMAGGGAPTLSAMQDFGYSGGQSGTGTRTLQGQQLDYQTALNAMDQLGRLQSNPFAMERVARGIDSTGIPNAVKGLMTGGAIPGFQAPQAKPQAPSLTGSLGIQNPSGLGGGPSSDSANLDASEANNNIGSKDWGLGADSRCETFAEQMTDGLNWGTTAANAFQNRLKAGQAVPDPSLKGAKPGDLVYLAPTPENHGYGHVGVYQGDGQITSATSYGVKKLPVTAFQSPVVGYATPSSGSESGLGGGPATGDPANPSFDPAAAAGVNVDATNAAAPNPNKLNAVQYTAAPQSVRDFVDSLYTSLGYAPTAVSETAKAQLPGFTAPRYGTVTA